MASTSTSSSSSSSSSSIEKVKREEDESQILGGREEKRVKVDDAYEFEKVEEEEDPEVKKIFTEFNARWKVESNGLPCGYRFSPSDIQLITHYLTNKILAKPLSSSDVIKDIDLYKHDADELPLAEFKLGKKNEAYFFTNLERKYAKGQLPNRTTKSGYWKGTGREVPVFSNNKEVVGYKKILVFYSGKAPNGMKTGWVMHEFRLHPSSVPVDALDDSIMAKIEKCVLCRIQYKKKKDKRAEMQRPENHQQSSESESSDSA